MHIQYNTCNINTIQHNNYYYTVTICDRILSSLVPRPHPLLVNLIAERGPGNTRHKNCRKHPTKTWGPNQMAACISCSSA